MRTLSHMVAAVAVIGILLLATGCSGRSNPTELHIRRAFETGSVDLEIRDEALSDGYSTLYRLFVVDRNAALLEPDTAVFDSERLSFTYTWTVDGVKSKGESERVVAFTNAGTHRISVSVSLGGRVLATPRRELTVDAIGEFEPERTVYLTLNEPVSYFAVPGTLDSGSPAAGLTRMSAQDGVTVLRADSGGFHLIHSSSNEERYVTNVFVSPVPTFHVDRVDRDWYFTQFRTLTTSNCGPTVVSMGIEWAAGAEVSVATVRSHVGWNGSGAVSMPELKSVLDLYEVDSSLHWIESPETIFDMLEAGNLVAVVYDMAGISYTANPTENLFGQYYIDSGGHYLMLKGFSLDRRYFVVYDPIPSDWTENAGRYGDGTSMYGRNRYYDVDELFQSLRSRQVLEIIG